MSNKANEILDEIVIYCNEELAQPTADDMCFGRQEMAVAILSLVDRHKGEPDKAERDAMDKLEEEILSGNRFCINGNCED
jgi:hypothetical protein